MRKFTLYCRQGIILWFIELNHKIHSYLTEFMSLTFHYFSLVIFTNVAIGDILLIYISIFEVSEKEFSNAGLLLFQLLKLNNQFLILGLRCVLVNTCTKPNSGEYSVLCIVMVPILPTNYVRRAQFEHMTTTNEIITPF